MSPSELRLALENIGIRIFLPYENTAYKYTSLKAATEILKSNRLYFSNPTAFNDPFDMNNSLVDTNVTKKEAIEWIKHYTHKSTAEKKKIIKEIGENTKKISNAMTFALEQQKKMTGVTCFSKSYSNTLLWSHYGDKHKGVCLGFKFFPTSPADDLLVMHVNYVDKIIPINYFRNQDIALFYWIFTKSHVWEYEEEIRAVVTNRTGLIEFSKSCLTEVHFGLRTTLQERSDFLNLLEILEYKITKTTFMSIDKTTFNLKENYIK